VRPDRTARGRDDDGDGEPRLVSAALVSDYVAGRLEPLMARFVEAAARRDPELSRAIEHAREVRRRVKERLTGSRQ
jgi:hypothetical protein